MIGLTKTCINKVLGRSYITSEHLSTLVTEIELILNDRPLTHNSAYINDPEPLTPSHLLHGRRIKSFSYSDERPTENNFHPKSHSELNEEAKTKFEILQSFWTRWRREYVTALREYQRASGKTETKVKVGDIVQIHDETKRIYWKLGIVENLITGRDGHVRAVNLRTSNGITNRPITKLYPLELHVDNIGDI